MCCRVDLHDTQRRAHAQSAIKNVDTKNDRVPLAEACDDFQTARPNSDGSCIAALGLDDLRVIRRECIEQVVDDVRYEGVDSESQGDRNGSNL